VPELATIPDLATQAGWLPLAFLAVMGLSILAYVILDGYDLGVGMLVPFASDDDKDVMVASIGPFWDANETWLVLGIGVLLVAFPVAHGVLIAACLAAGYVLLGAAWLIVKTEGALQRRAVGLYVLAFYGLAYSLFPYLVVDRLDIWQAASAPESLLIIFWGAAVVLPVIVLYSVFAYRIFGGKARVLDYG